MLYILILAQNLYLRVCSMVLLPAPLGWHMGRKQTMLQWAEGLGMLTTQIKSSGMANRGQPI